MAAIAGPQRPFQVRTASVEDAAGVSDMATYTFIHTYAHSLTKEQLNSYLDCGYRPAAITQCIQDTQKEVLVATDAQDTVVGVAMLTRGTSIPVSATDQPDGVVELQRLYIHPDAQGCGVGRLLFTEIERSAKNQGFRHIWLSVWEENTKAQKVYERMGFVKIGEQPFDVGGAIQTDHILLKRL